MDPLNILHVVNIVAPRYGGAGIASKLIACYQAKIGHNVTICTTNIDFPRGTLTVPSGEPVFGDKILIWHFEVSFRPLLLSIPLWKWLKSKISSFDVVHIHGLYRFPVSVAAWYARKANVPYLISPHGSLDPFLYKQSRYNVFLKRIYELFIDIPNLNHAAAIHYTTEEEAKQANFLGLKSFPIIVPIGIDWNRFQHLPRRGNFRRRLNLDDQSPLVLFLGRKTFTKGLDLLIASFSLVVKKHPTANLTLVGPDNEGYCSKVKQWCIEQGIQNRVLFVDHLGSEEVKEAYVDADVFVLPSYTENFGLTVVEAMACCTPVIISDHVKICHQVQETRAGFVVRLDHNDLAAAICQMLENKSAAKAIGTMGRVAAKNLYTWPRIITQLTQIYQDLINSKNNRKGIFR